MTDWLPPEITGKQGNGGGGGTSDGIVGSGTTANGSTNLNTTEAKLVEHGRMMVALSEGPGITLVNGIKSIYLDGTPIQNSDNSFNFNGLSIAMTSGTNTQACIPGFVAVESEVSVNTKVIATASITKTISTPGLSGIRVIVGVPALKSINPTTGVESGTSVEIGLERKSDHWNGGAWESVDLCEDPSIHYGVIKGKFGTRYTKGYRIDFPADGPWQVRMQRRTGDSTSEYLLNETWWDSYTEIVDARLRYPNVSVMGIMLNAQAFPNLPQVHADCYGVQCHVPANYDPIARTYATTGTGTSGGTWDGTFKLAWTNNPAWLFYETATNTRWGAGLPVSAVDKWTLYSISQVCDEDVDDGLGGTEPRFTCSVHLQQSSNAIKVLNDLAGAFRGMLYSAGGQVVPVQDVDSQPVAIFTKANVKDGMFTYSGVARQSRHNAALVTWIDPAAGYTQAVEAVENAASIARYGYNPIEVEGLGLTTCGAAQRLGIWVLLSEEMQGETVTCEAAIDSLSVHPGDVVQILDPKRNGYGGRVSSATTTQVTLDRSVILAAGQTYKLKCRLDTGAVEERTVSTGAGTASVLTVSAFSSAPPTMGVWALHEASSASLWRVVSIKDSGPMHREVTALYHDPAKYALCDLPTIQAFTSAAYIPPAPISNLVVSAGTAVRQNVISPFVNAVWTVCANAIGYRADASLDDGPWLPMRVSGHYAELVNAEPGDYRIRVVAVYRNGKTSIPVESTTNVPDTDLPPAIQSLADSISDFSSDSKFSPVEKSSVRKEWNTLPGDKSVLDAQATAFSITTEKTTYDNAFQALATYLNNGTTWTSGIPTWIADANLGTTTTIVPATFRSKFQDYYDSRTALTAAISAVAKAIADGAQTGVNVLNTDDTLSRAKKPELLIRYNTELQVQTDLDSKATTLSVSHTAYDNAVTAVTTFLHNLGGSSPNWAYLNMATDTALGSGGGASLRTLWDTVASTRSALQSAIAGAYPAYQIAAGATDAMQKAVFTTANKVRGDLMVERSVFAKSIVAANWYNLIPNANSEADITSAPSGAYESGGVDSTPGYARNGTKCRSILTNTAYTALKLVGEIACSEGDAFYFEGWAKDTNGSHSYSPRLMIRYYDANLATTSWCVASKSSLNGTYVKLSTSGTAPATTTGVEFIVDSGATVISGGLIAWDDFYARRMSDASVIVDGTLTTLFCRVGNDIQSTNYSAGTTGNAPVGMRISAFPFTATYLDGTTDATCQMEIGGSISIGGYKAVTICDKIFNNSVTLTGSGYWTAPAGVTRVEVLAVGPGGNGAKHASGGGGGGGGGSIRTIVAVTPGTAYAYVVGTPGTDTTFAAGTITARAGANASGTTGGAGKGPQYTDANSNVINLGGSPGHGASSTSVHTVDTAFLCYGGGGGSTSEGGGSVDAYAGGGYSTGGGGGASGFSPGGIGGSSASGTTPAGFGGGGGGTATGASAGAGAHGTIILRW